MGTFGDSNTRLASTDQPKTSRLRVCDGVKSNHIVAGRPFRGPSAAIIPVAWNCRVDSQFDTLSWKTRGTLADYSSCGTINCEYENDPGGPSRTAQAGHGIQKVGGSTPPGSTSPKSDLKSIELFYRNAGGGRTLEVY